MPLEDPALQYLARPENLSLALDISKKVERLKIELHRQFWQAISSNLQDRLAASVYVERYVVVGLDQGKVMNTWAGLAIKPFPRRTHVIVFPNLSQTTPEGDFRLAYGIHWSQLYQDEFDTSAVRILIGRLNQQGFKTTDWWPGMKNLDIWLRREKFLLAMANDEEQFIMQMADTIWRVFVDNEPYLATANRELGQLEQ